MMTYVATLMLCAAIGSEKAPDLSPGWHDVCVEIGTAAHDVGVDPAIAIAVGWRESRFDRYAVGRDSELGPMQAKAMHCTQVPCDWLRIGVEVLDRYIDDHGIEGGLCRYKGAPAGCEAGRTRLALARRIGVVL